MAYRSFGHFVEALEQAGELKRVAHPGDTDLLIAEWANREMKSPGGGKGAALRAADVDGKNRNSRSRSTPWVRATHGDGA